MTTLTPELFLEAITNVVEQRRADAALIRAQMREWRRQESTYARELRPIFEQLGIDVAKLYSVEMHDELMAESTRKERDEVPGRVVDSIMVAATGNQTIEVTRRRLFEHQERHYIRIMRKAEAFVSTRLGVDVGIPDGRANAILREGGKRIGLVDVSADTRDAIFRALAQAREEQIGPIQAARRIRELVPEGRFRNAGARYRSQLIARTETLHAQRRSSIEGYRAADTVEGLFAHDALLGDTDQECIDRDGSTFTFDDAEVETASTHPSCTLNFSPIVRSEL